MLNDLAKEIHKNAVEHGWWDEPRVFGEIVALCHSELSEALEEYRAGRPMVWRACKVADVCCDPGRYYHTAHCCQGCGYRDEKPEGIAVEMADCVIRILDWAEHEGIDMDAIIREKMEYNKTRRYRHGGKVL